MKDGSSDTFVGTAPVITDGPKVPLTRKLLLAGYVHPGRYEVHAQSEAE